MSHVDTEGHKNLRACTGQDFFHHLDVLFGDFLVAESTSAKSRAGNLPPTQQQRQMTCYIVIRIPYYPCKNPGGDCYWDGGYTSKLLVTSFCQFRWGKRSWELFKHATFGM